MAPRDWNLNMSFLQVAIPISGKRKEEPAKDFISRIHYCNPRRMIMKNCDGYFMWPSPVQKHIYIYPTAVFEIMAKKQNLPYLLKKSAQDLTCPLKNRYLSGQAISDFQFLLLQGQQPPEMERIEMDFINRVLENFQMNVTALNNYLQMPAGILFQKSHPHSFTQK